MSFSEAQTITPNPLVLPTQIPNPTSAIPFTAEMGGVPVHNHFTLDHSVAGQGSFSALDPLTILPSGQNIQVTSNEQWLSYHPSAALPLATPDPSPVEGEGDQFHGHPVGGLIQFGNPGAVTVLSFPPGILKAEKKEPSNCAVESQQFQEEKEEKERELVENTQ